MNKKPKTLDDYCGKEVILVDGKKREYRGQLISWEEKMRHFAILPPTSHHRDNLPIATFPEGYVKKIEDRGLPIIELYPS